MPRQHDKWAKQVTYELEKNLNDAGCLAYENGCGLYADAMLLFEAQRHARAAALGVLAEEEFSKALILLLCAQNGRWDSVIYEALHRHSHKQGFVDGMCGYLDWFSSNFKQVMESTSISRFQLQPATFPGDGIMDEIVNEAKRKLRTHTRDHLKQDALYVKVSEQGAVTKTPNSVSPEEAQQCLSSADFSRVLVEVQLSKPDAALQLAKRLRLIPE